MKHILISCVMILLTASWALAETSLWKAQKGNSIIYLGGTIHILRSSDLPPPPEFEKAYDASDVVVFEADLSKIQSFEFNEKLTSELTYPDGDSIDKHLSPKMYSDLSEFCKARGIPLEFMKQYKPSLITILLTFMELMKLGFDQEGVDLYFYQMALKDGKSVESFETIDEQIGFLASMADGADGFVAYSLNDIKDMKWKIEALIDAWRKGDVGKLNELALSELKTKQPENYKKLIVDRNLQWLPKIEAYLKTPRTTEFILVGAAHLVGPDGVLENLKKRGYRVDKL